MERPNANYPGNALALLESMNSGQPWTPAQAQRYTLFLMALPAALGLRAVINLCGREWRPAPDAIMEEAARIALCETSGNECPLPAPDEVYAEIMHKKERFGLYGRKLPNRNVYLAGAPSFSHPIVAQVVAHLGRWEKVCSGEANFSEGLSKQINTIYERLRSDWIAKVVQSLRSAPNERPAELFPRWIPYRVPSGWTETPASVPAIEAKTEVVDMPDSIRRMIAQLREDKRQTLTGAGRISAE